MRRAAKQAVNVRMARRGDAGVIAAFNVALAQESEGRRLNAKRVLAGVKALLADRAKGQYFVAVSDGQVVGQLMVTYEWSDWRNGNFWWLQSVYVRPEFRRGGVFRSLFAFMRKAAKRGNVCGLRLYVERENVRGKKTYERLGLGPTHYEVYEWDYVLKL